MVFGDKRAGQALPLKRPTRLGEEVYNAIYAQLMSREISPGGRISVDRLVRELGVSQTPIREALSRLEAEGLVVKTHLIGYSAANQMDRSRLEQLYELRLLLEPHAAARAALNMTDEARATLSKLASEMEAGSNENISEAYGRFAQLDGQFHDLIAHAGGNDLVQETLASLHTHVHLFRLFYHARVTSDAISEHRHIIEAISARDAEATRQSMHIHIERSQARFMKAFAPS
ncbi:GntR family transcriptional regulator [Devosia sp. BK]|uniref:GntR family transcriptional regulator n=1 Tax=Devosia sp. BK TaxID=2871706 RepID=UPI002939A32C|nr:GntR family transcriptional regulator [Devosia sp. BK]MDV3249717.1 GntR family transcriptional regulator [Devosia sp. BK]